MDDRSAGDDRQSREPNDRSGQSNGTSHQSSDTSRQSNDASAVSDETLDDLLEEWFEESGAVGVSVAVCDGTESMYETGRGTTTTRAATRATETTRFAVGSVAKPVTATAVLRLADAGELALSDPVAAHLPWFDDAPGEPITIHQLLTHSSGLPTDGMELFVVGAALGVDTGRTLDDWSAFRAYVREWFDTRGEPGRFAYSNAGYTALGRVIERVTGESFAAAIDRLVFDPLEIEATFDTGRLTGDDAAPPHRPDGEPVTLPNNPLFVPSGGLIVAPRELARFGAVHATAGRGRSPGEGFLDLAAAAHDGHVTWRRYVGGQTTGAGYGWEVSPFDGDTLVGHSGSTGLSAGYLGFLQERMLTVAVACTGQPTNSPERLGRAMLARLTGRDPVAVDPERALDRKLAPLSGRYESPNGVHRATVRTTSGRLELAIDGPGPVGDDTMAAVPRSLDPADRTFTIHEDGELDRAAFAIDDGVTLRWGPILLERTGPVETTDDEPDTADDSESDS